MWAVLLDSAHEIRNKWKEKRKETWHFALRSEEYEITGLCSNKEHGGKCGSANVSGELK